MTSARVGLSALEPGTGQAVRGLWALLLPFLGGCEAGRPREGPGSLEPDLPARPRAPGLMLLSFSSRTLRLAQTVPVQLQGAVVGYPMEWSPSPHCDHQLVTKDSTNSKQVIDLASSPRKHHCWNTDRCFTNVTEAALLTTWKCSTDHSLRSPETEAD